LSLPINNTKDRKKNVSKISALWMLLFNSNDQSSLLTACESLQPVFEHQVNCTTSFNWNG